MDLWEFPKEGRCQRDWTQHEGVVKSFEYLQILGGVGWAGREGPQNSMIWSNQRPSSHKTGE